MNIIEESVGILYTVTVALKAPVVLGILLGLVWVLLESGAFLREHCERRRRNRRWTALLFDFLERRSVSFDDCSALLSCGFAPEIAAHFAADFARPSQSAPALRLSRLLQNVEFEAAGRISRMRLGLRLGPVLGLMGTLIPMGPALMNVSQGNLAMMSNDLIIAFGTTVAGLLIGALCYVMLTARQHWYSKDMADIENAAALLETPDGRKAEKT